MSYTVYMHISPSGKKYVGITCQNVKRRWMNGHGYKENEYFYRAIQKYGWDNFRHLIVTGNLTKDAACKLEVELIAHYDTTNYMRGYNITSGGEGATGFHHNEETCKKMSESRKGDKNNFYGKHHTDETRKQLSKLKKGVYPFWNMKGVLCLETGKVYSSIQDASDETGLSRSHIGDVCRGKRKTTGGYHWKFLKGVKK